MSDTKIDDRIMPIPPEWTATGWSVPGWAARLRQMADRCEGLHPDRADELRRMAGEHDGTGSVKDLHDARLQCPEPKRTMPTAQDHQAASKASKRKRACEAQRSPTRLLFGPMEAVEDDGAAA